ncbi:MAG: hypothetical protein ABIW79_07435 [Gemmatimonas sp.]
MILSSIITLSNGKKVANFSSPHPFTFTDGSILPAVDNATSNFLKVIFIETQINDKGDISLEFMLSDTIKGYMGAWLKEYQIGNVDVVFCPLPMITALHNDGVDLSDSPFRAIRMENRIKKLVSIDKQCI